LMMRFTRHPLRIALLTRYSSISNAYMGKL
jgi:hypothetical protein